MPTPPPPLKQSTILAKVEKLKKEQATMRAARVKLTAELRNANKQKSRLKKRAKLLTDTDLLEVIHLRAGEKELREASVVPPELPPPPKAGAGGAV